MCPFCEDNALEFQDGYNEKEENIIVSIEKCWLICCKCNAQIVNAEKDSEQGDEFRKCSQCNQLQFSVFWYCKVPQVCIFRYLFIYYFIVNIYYSATMEEQYAVHVKVMQTISCFVGGVETMCALIILVLGETIVCTVKHEKIFLSIFLISPGF